MEHHTWAGQALGLAALRAELSSPLQGHACAACQACQHACRAQQVTCYTTWTLRFELVPCSSLLPHFFSTMYFLLPCLCIREIVDLFHCPWPNATSSHTFLIHHLATAPHQAMHQDNTSELVQSKLFQKSLLIENMDGLPSLPQALYGTVTSPSRLTVYWLSYIDPATSPVPGEKASYQPWQSWASLKHSTGL